MSNVENVTVSEKDKRKRCENEDEGITFLKLRHVNKFKKKLYIGGRNLLEKRIIERLYGSCLKNEKSNFFWENKATNGCKISIQNIIDWYI